MTQTSDRSGTIDKTPVSGSQSDWTNVTLDFENIGVKGSDKNF